MTSVEHTLYATRRHSSPRPVLTQPGLIETFVEFEGIKRKAETLCAGLSREEFNRRPEPKKWSLAQCIEHLNLAGYEMALPAIERLITAERELGLKPTSDYRNGKVGEWFIRNGGPESKRRFKTFKRFETSAFLEIDETIDRFLRVQDLLIERLQWADELNIGKLRTRNAAMIPLNLDQWFRFTAAHEQRHLEQGSRAVEGGSVK